MPCGFGQEFHSIIPKKYFNTFDLFTKTIWTINEDVIDIRNTPSKFNQNWASPETDHLKIDWHLHNWIFLKKSLALNEFVHETHNF